MLTDGDPTWVELVVDGATALMPPADDLSWAGGAPEGTVAMGGGDTMTGPEGRVLFDVAVSLTSRCNPLRIGNMPRDSDAP